MEEGQVEWPCSRLIRKHIDTTWWPMCLCFYVFKSATSILRRNSIPQRRILNGRQLNNLLVLNGTEIIEKVMNGIDLSTV